MANGHRAARATRARSVAALGVAVLAAGTTGVLPLGAAARPAAASTPPPAASVEAWIYPSSPGQPACDVPAELAPLDSTPVAVLKAEYLNVRANGRVATESAASLPCNGFSTANLAAVRSAAHAVLVTVSSGGRSTRALLRTPARRAAALSAIESFVSANALDGVDLDFEPGRWSSAMWGAYVSLVSSLTGALVPAGKTVEVDLEPFTTTPWDAQRYGDVAAAGARVVVMAYDHEFDAPCAPITPYGWLQQVVAYAQSQVPAAQLTVGLPAYGYTTTTCARVAHVTSNVAYVTMESSPGFPGTPAATAALRDPASGELRWDAGGVFHDVVDADALNAKLAVVEALGVSDVSVWSLGGEPWFDGNPG